jgi:hypothetical protein
LASSKMQKGNINVRNILDLLAGRCTVAEYEAFQNRFLEAKTPNHCTAGPNISKWYYKQRYA